MNVIEKCSFIIIQVTMNLKETQFTEDVLFFNFPVCHLNTIESPHTVQFHAIT